ncbi:MAG TPA: hypothetical protein VF508_09080 [Pyrinomonadaceae bacterium]|jgi:hypothetical protein
MFWKILARIFRRHITYHLLIPLVVGVCVDFLAMLVTHSWPHVLVEMQTHLLSAEGLGLIGGIFAAYFVIMYFVVKEETTARIDSAGQAILSGCLQGAASYFAVNVIGIREWFGPATQEYLSVIARRHRDNPGFRHERVLLFFSERDFDDLVTPYLDYNYAHALVQIHKNYDIPLSFLRRKDIHRILSALTDHQRKVVGCYGGWLGWFPKKVFGYPLWRLRRRFAHMGFALIEMEHGETVVLRVSKHGDNMNIEKIAGHAADPYAKVVKLIKHTVHDPATHAVKTEYDFANRVKL